MSQGFHSATAYMSPEIEHAYHNKHIPMSDKAKVYEYCKGDIWSLGATFYQMCTGELYCDVSIINN